MSVAGLVLLLMIFTYTGCCEAGTRFAGPFDVVVKEAADCDDKGNGDVIFENVVVRKKSRTLYTVSVDVTFNRIITDDDIGVTVNFSVWGNGGWRPNFLALPYKELCKTMANVLPDVFDQLMEAANRTSCPIPPGRYRVVDSPGLPVVTIPSLPYNKYKLLFNLVDNNGVLLGCQGLIANIVPKEKKRG